MVNRNEIPFYALATLNVVDEKQMRTGGFYSPSSGNFIVNDNYDATFDIYVQAGDSYRTNASSVSFYDSNFVFVSGITLSALTASSGVFTIPSGAVYMRVNFTSSLTYPICTKNINNYLQAYEKAKYIDDGLIVTKDNIGKDFIITPRQSDFFYAERTVNLFDPEDVVLGRYNDKGVYAYSVTSPQVTSKFIPVVEGDRITTTTSGYVTFYDVNKNLISGLPPCTTFTVPAGVSYVRTTSFLATKHLEMVVKGTTLPSEYVPYYHFKLKPEYLVPPNSKLQGKKLNTIGDSITDADWGGVKKYDSVIAEKHGMNLMNYGIGGTRIARASDKPDAFVDRWMNMRDDADIIFLMGGTNDIYADIPIGTIDSTDPTTFMGALNIICSGLQRKYVGKPIGFATPILARGRDRATCLLYADAMIEVCEKHAIPVLDLTRKGQLNPENYDVWTTLYRPDDTVHLNDVGQTVLARSIESFLESIV